MTGGSKLNRSEIVSVRLDPKLRYLAELAARRHRRTLSSFIEWAVSEQIALIILGTDSILAESDLLWDVNEANRFEKLATLHPELLTYQEEINWKSLQAKKKKRRRRR